MKVKVLGSGCSKCKALEKKLQDIRSASGMEFELEKVTQLEDILDYGVMMTPGLVIDEKVVSFGKVPSDRELLVYLAGGMK